MCTKTSSTPTEGILSEFYRRSLLYTKYLLERCVNRKPLKDPLEDLLPFHEENTACRPQMDRVPYDKQKLSINSDHLRVLWTKKKKTFQRLSINTYFQCMNAVYTHESVVWMVDLLKTFFGKNTSWNSYIIWVQEFINASCTWKAPGTWKAYWGHSMDFYRQNGTWRPSMTWGFFFLNRIPQGQEYVLNVFYIKTGYLILSINWKGPPINKKSPRRLCEPARYKRPTKCHL